ncbi:MAG TPA: DUF4258 domain-containing protein [Candidatus Avalokitesvara rifleensis]|uniref:DUF4258 domain-containing protein n=1 Tax=Candidatus Avalokitesvara rifleensis TaxID=3367620 RepID=UPI00271316A4|nr:DUF4258 domain-containing protein [Candidatus Brocadiales bacterium]
MSIILDFIHNEIEKQTYEISFHADDERIADELTVSQLEFVLSQCKIIEQYLDDPRGESCLTVGFTPEGVPVHIICGKNPSGHLILITVYIPNMPKWRNPYTRNKSL